MNEKIEQTLSEIRQMREQYVAEVGEGRRAWPRSIRERVHWLGQAGLKPREISNLTGIPYETVCQWKYQKSLSSSEGFHNLTVTVPAKSLSTKNLAVPVKSRDTLNVTVTVKTPDGYLIEGMPAHMLIEFIRSKVG